MKKILASSAVFALLAISGAPVFAAGTFSAFADDTIAGYSAFLKTTKLDPNTKVDFTVVKPDKSRLMLETTATAKGVAGYEIDGYHTREAGSYYVAVRLKDGSKSDMNVFLVFPDDLSDSHSTVEVSKSTLRADGNHSGILLVALRDKYDNPLSDHMVRAVSSRAADTVTAYGDSSITDASGEVGFLISSEKLGVSTFTVSDVTSDITLSARPQIFFYDKTDSAALPDDSDFAFLAVGGESKADHFALDELPVQIKANQAISFDLVVEDAADNPVIDYLGTVRFSSTDANAELPVDYLFTEDDLGLHSFKLSLKFSKEGAYKLTLTDKNNENLKTDFDIAVVKADAQAVASTGIVLTSPKAGKTKQSTVLVTGTASARALVKIFDGTSQAGVVQANETGAFSFELTALADGDHAIKVQSGSDESEPVTVGVDTLAPGVDQFRVEPSAVAPGGTVTVTVATDDDALEVMVKLGSVLKQLTKKQNGQFEGAFAAPDTVGSYKFEVTLKDALGNQQTVPDQSSLTVSGSAALSLNTGSTTFEVPSQVIGVQAIPSNSQVTLRWAPARDNTGVAKYNVYYGTSPSNLNQKQATFDNRTEWFVTGLKNGVTYYFQIKGVDTEGHEADQPSQTVSAAAGGGGAPASSQFLDGGAIAPPGVTPTGPGIAAWFGISSVATWFVRRKKHKL